MKPRIEFARITPDGLAAMRGLESYVHGSGLEPRLLELVKVRTARLPAAGSGGHRGRAMTAVQRVFSGVQPTGAPNLGNYLGAISLWVAMQAEYDAVFCIADLHALTTPETVRPAHLRATVRETAAVLLACGVDPTRAILFVQSRVPAHAELAWLLSTPHRSAGSSA